MAGAAVPAASAVPLAGPGAASARSALISPGASEVGSQLRKALAPGVAVVIADLTETSSCDSSGMRNLLLAHNEAVAGHPELRLVVPAAAVLRVMELTGLLETLRVHPSTQPAPR